jgi:hypothetical protein
VYVWFSIAWFVALCGAAGWFIFLTVDAMQPLVLVVDNDASMLKGVARLLRQLGYASVVFSSAAGFRKLSRFQSISSEEALLKAKELARAEQGKLT